jgi:hypothetical protein
LDDLPAVDNVGLISCHGLKLWVKRVKHSLFWSNFKSKIGHSGIVTLFLSKLCSLNGGYFECDYPRASDAWEAHDANACPRLDGWLQANKAGDAKHETRTGRTTNGIRIFMATFLPSRLR